MRADCHAMRVGVLTDIHVVEDTGRTSSWHNRYDFAGVEERIARAAELFAAEGVEDVLVLGDLAHDGDEPSLRRALEPLTGGPPLHVVGGNHDGPGATAVLATLGVTELRLPGWRALPSADGRVGIAGVRVARRASGRWGLARRPALLTWRERPVLLATHYPVISRLEPVRAAALPYAGDLADREALAQPFVERAAPTVVVCGHLHVREGIAEGALLQLACCALVEPPFEATVLALEAAGEGALSVSRFAHELGGATELRRDPRLTSAEETWQFSPLRGWRRSRPGSRGPRAPRRAP
jgi:Calcineurin-like phosphoesterase